MTRQAAIGRASPRRDGIAKVTGRARYVDDQTLPGMLHGVTLAGGVAVKRRITGADRADVARERRRNLHRFESGASLEV